MKIVAVTGLAQKFCSCSFFNHNRYSSRAHENEYYEYLKPT